MCLLQMSSSSSNSSASTEPWTADKRQKTGNDKHKVPKKICGSYNHTGCKVADCRFVHQYDRWAGANYYFKINSNLQQQKGLIIGSQYPQEFEDLRMRNKDSLTNTELMQLAKMPPLASKGKPTTAKVAETRKKVGPKVSTHESKLAQPVGIDEKSEPAKPKLTREEREASIRAERKEYVDEHLLKAFRKATEEGNYSTLGEMTKTINWEADIDLNIKLVALDLEYQQQVCYMHQELREGKNGQDDRVYHHRFQLLTPGALGAFKPNGPCNQSNVGDLASLLRNLNELMVDEGDDSYVCRSCFQPLYPRKTRRERILCACLRCVSVMYCSPWCREEDAHGHQLSCFLHPAWECEEGTKRRVEEMNAAGLKAQPLVEQKAPAIGAVPGLRVNSRVRPDPAAHLIAEQEIAAQQGVDDDLDVVGVSDEDAKDAAKATAKTDGDTATTKTAIGGMSDVEVAEA